MVRLRCKETYRSQHYQYDAGDEFEVDDAVAAWLMRDAPGCFEEAVDKPPASKAPDKPAADKQVKAPAAKK